jgi:hypothetical protein
LYHEGPLKDAKLWLVKVGTGIDQAWSKVDAEAACDVSNIGSVGENPLTSRVITASARTDIVRRFVVLFIGGEWVVFASLLLKL